MTMEELRIKTEGLDNSYISSSSERVLKGFNRCANLDISNDADTINERVVQKSIEDTLRYNLSVHLKLRKLQFERFSPYLQNLFIMLIRTGRLEVEFSDESNNIFIFIQVLLLAAYTKILNILNTIFAVSKRKYFVDTITQIQYNNLNC